MLNTDREWLETDGLGGFASGTVSGRRSRRYHALLLAASRPPTGRYVLVNGCEVYVTTGQDRVALSSQHYAPNVIHPHGDRRLHSFTSEPWPVWRFQLSETLTIVQELFVPHRSAAVAMRWKIESPGPELVTLSVRPLLSGRDYHALHHENSDFQFECTGEARKLTWTPYRHVPGISIISNGSYSAEPLWYRQFYYAREAERGLDCTEDLASPGAFHFDLRASQAVWILTATTPQELTCPEDQSPVELFEQLRKQELDRRKQFVSPLHRAADQYLVTREGGQTIIAGYPWFTDWGRDTFIALPGLCFATGRLKEAGQILQAWARSVSEGMVPNRFPDSGETPEYNSVDASLWYVLAVQNYLQHCETQEKTVPAAVRTLLRQSVLEILTAYAEGTRFGIAADEDGLLRAGAPGLQLTWMDAKVGDWVVTPRMGKPVEVQALWINALCFGARLETRWGDLYELARSQFTAKFWNPRKGCLYDVIDVDHCPGQVNDQVRPNQILAAGGLPICLLNEEHAARVVALVEDRLWTPLGLRTLEPGVPGYQPHCTGNQHSRDAAYHQGTAWPWLTGPFVKAWLRSHGETPQAYQTARHQFLQPLLDHLNDFGIGHVSEIADGDATSTGSETRQIARGCPFQAWSLAELLRLLALPGFQK
jgi:predicted glycogen debranching enzyme